MPSFRDEVRELWPSLGKFGSRRAAIAWLVTLDDCADEDTGSIDWDVWVARIGRTLVFTDDRGFVWCERHVSEDSARAAFNGIDNAYGEWDSEDDDDMEPLTCPQCGSSNVTAPHAHHLAKCDSCHLAFDTMEDE